MANKSEVDRSRIQPVVCLLFRKSLPGVYSIERVFQQVALQLRTVFLFRETFVPFSSGSVTSLLRNLFMKNKPGADVYHVTGDVHYMVWAFPRKKTLLTIHDCGFIEQHHGIRKWFFRHVFLKWPVAYSHLVTTISEQTKQEVIKYTGCRADKIVVIPNPLSNHIYFKARAFRSNQPVLLFIGITPNKNLERVIHALSGINCLLDIVGKLPADMEKLLQQQGISYTSSFSLSDQQIADKYNNADVILFPTLLEGFGLPIIEGQKAGRVVITSNLPPMNEVAGGGACLVDPYQVESIRQAVMKVIHDTQYRQDMINKGFVNVKKYQPQQIAQKYVQVYRQLNKQITVATDSILYE